MKRRTSGSHSQVKYSHTILIVHVGKLNFSSKKFENVATASVILYWLFLGFEKKFNVIADILGKPNAARAGKEQFFF